jgi:hypothetical protein
MASQFKLFAQALNKFQTAAQIHEHISNCCPFLFFILFFLFLLPDRGHGGELLCPLLLKESFDVFPSRTQ